VLFRRPSSGNRAAFVEHTLFVLMVPLVFLALAAVGRELARAIWRAT